MIELSKPYGLPCTCTPRSTPSAACSASQASRVHSGGEYLRPRRERVALEAVEDMRVAIDGAARQRAGSVSRSRGPAAERSFDDDVGLARDLAPFLEVGAHVGG